MDDLDEAVCRAEHERTQQDDLRALGVDWDGPVLRQSERRGAYDAAIELLRSTDRTYTCYCSRSEILAAASAPNAPGPAPEGAYPGTCRTLSRTDRAEREAAGRRPALRLDAQGAVVSFDDRLGGHVEVVVDDVVLRRNDETPAYNLAVVVDDAAQNVEEVVRGDDLLFSTPRQILIGRLLGLRPFSYVHVPMVLSPDGKRLAKRDGAVTLANRAAQGESPEYVVGWLAASLGLAERGECLTSDDVLRRFDFDRLPRTPWQLASEDL